jgi:adenine-specific DNA-methyltransferase
MTDPLFLSLPEWVAWVAANRGVDVSLDDLQSLVDLYLIPEYQPRSKDEDAVALYLREDVLGWLPILSQRFATTDFLNPTMFDRGPLRRLRLATHTHIELGHATNQIPAVLLPLLRTLALRASRTPEEDSPQLGIPFNTLLAGTAHVRTTSSTIFGAVQDAVVRLNSVEKRDENDFARTANYMGSKRTLRGFIVEAIQSFVPEGGAVLDLMCGSGAAAAAFNSLWTTFASDAQAFSRVLAKVQGGGFSEAAASHVLERVAPLARDHAGELEKPLASFLAAEDEILFRDADDDAIGAFQRLAAFPTYPKGRASECWDPNLEVGRRKLDHRKVPYCLFTTYFGNVYFGIRQSVEIDSIRYAIDQLEEFERSWALGALIATLSSVATTHAAHFAQPKFPPGKQLSLEAFSVVQEQRSRSVLHEFSIRLLTLGRQSEQVPRAIQPVDGPWRAALASLHARRPSAPLLVYVDAPYTRDEYSRYYHVLETLVTYAYPESIGIGRTPAKGSGPSKRFISEFFTKTTSGVVTSLVELILAVLERGWTCAWSYASNGAAWIPTVVDAVASKRRCNVYSFSAPYVHNSQGRHVSPKRVVEYLLVFVPL